MKLILPVSPGGIFYLKWGVRKEFANDQSEIMIEPQSHKATRFHKEISSESQPAPDNSVFYDPD